MRRVGALAFFLGLRSVACAVFNADVQAHITDRSLQISLDISGERFERRDVECVQACGRIFPQFNQRWQKSCERFTTPRWCDEQARRIARAIEQILLMGMNMPAVGGKPIGEFGGKLRHVSEVTPWRPVGKSIGKTALALGEACGFLAFRFQRDDGVDDVLWQCGICVFWRSIKRAFDVFFENADCVVFVKTVARKFDGIKAARKPVLPR